MKQIILKLSIAVLLIGMLLLPSCAPVFSELQSARMVGKNKIEATPSASYINFSEGDDTEYIQEHLGLQLAYGVSDKVDLRLRYEHISSDGEGLVSVLGFGPKFSLIENRLAFNLPVGTAFGNDYERSWQMHPSLIFTIPTIENKMDINLAPKYLLSFCKDCDDLVAFNLGLSLSSDLKKWAIRPEYGVLINPGESGYFGQFSLGFTKSFGL